MRIVYTGPHRAVIVDGIRRPVEKNVPVDVRDELAASLLEQSIWEPADAGRPPATGKGSGLAAWTAYAELLGIHASHLDGLTKADVIALVDTYDPTATAPPVPEEITP